MSILMLYLSSVPLTVVVHCKRMLYSHPVIVNRRRHVRCEAHMRSQPRVISFTESHIFHTRVLVVRSVSIYRRQSCICYHVFPPGFCYFCASHYNCFLFNGVFPLKHTYAVALRIPPLIWMGIKFYRYLQTSWYIPRNKQSVHLSLWFVFVDNVWAFRCNFAISLYQ